MQVEATSELNPVELLSRDLKKATVTLSPREVRYLVDGYYQIQEYRKAAASQVRVMEKEETREPHEVLSWFFAQTQTLENQIKRALDAWSASKPLGQWARSVLGIGPVISAGLMAHIDVEKAPTVGHIWSFAGLDPRAEWKKGEKRPWNASLKLLCWKVGESFVKVSGKEKSLYGRLFVERKAYEWKENDAGKYADQARAKLKKFNIGTSTEAYVWYSGQLTPGAAQQIREVPEAGRQKLLRELAQEPYRGSVVPLGTPMLPPAHIHARARRWVVKLFLAHYHAQAYRLRYDREPPNPYPIEHMGHVHWISPEVADTVGV